MGSVYLWLKLPFATFGQRIAKWWNFKVKPSFKPSSIVSPNKLFHNPFNRIIRGMKKQMFNQQFLWIVLACGFGYVFPVIQKITMGITLNDSEKIGILVVILAFIGAWKLSQKMELDEKEERLKELTKAFKKALIEARNEEIDE